VNNNLRKNSGTFDTPESSTKDSSETVSLKVLRFRAGARLRAQADKVAREEPLEVRVQGHSVVVTMRTPGQDQELAAGFLFTEGVVQQGRDLIEIAPCRQSDSPENILNVFLAPGVEIDFERLRRHVFATSSCGLCGKASIDAVHQNFPPVKSDIKVTSRTLLQLPRRMRALQHTFSQTGGLHAAAVFNAHGKLVALREDIGRHNAVDKVVGHGLLTKALPFSSHILLVSGRASFEIIQKALAARIPVVCAISAPSSLAVEFAKESGQTLVGFLGNRTMNIYTGAERIRAV
jgi:FdhD protein